MISLLVAASLFLQLPSLRLPDAPPLPPITREAQVTYLDREGRLIGTRGGRWATPVNVDKLPSYVPAAFVAIEDRRFYEHQGFDPVGIGRAIVNNISERRLAEGASTITQQLAKNLFLSNDRTLERKATELAYAIQLEQKYSKKEILGLYLSRVYFGGGAYGLEAAAQRYFGKTADKLTLKEAALLAGVLKSPTAYNPAEHPRAAADRSALVLAAMQETGAITQAQRTAALREAPRVFTTAPFADAQYFVDWVDAEVRRVSGPVRQDLVVETTLDLPATIAAATAAREGLARLPGGASQGQAAVVGVDGEGRVRIMVGGANHATAPFNRAVSARRQAGSAWKPFVYLAALEAGWTPEALVVDGPVSIGGWSPANYTPGFAGEMSLEQALARSVNTVAASLANEVGQDRVAQAARRAGITSAINTEPAMALGTSLVTPLEMASAYAALSNGGNRVRPFGLVRVRTTTGGVLHEAWAPPPQPAIANPALSDLNRMLRTVVASGTGTRARVQGLDVAGKTGTTSDYRDAWFAGFTGNLALTVWMGRDDNRPLGTVTGGTLPAEVWAKAMQAAARRLPVTAIPPGPPAPERISPLDALFSALGGARRDEPVP